MSQQIMVFDWVPEWVKDQIIELLQDPKNITLDELEDIAQEIKLELDDLNNQIKIESIKAKSEETFDSEIYLSWKQRILMRLRVKNTVYGVIIYNLRKLKAKEQSELENQLLELNLKIKKLEENLESQKKMKKLEEKCENIMRHLTLKQHEEHLKLKKDIRNINEHINERLNQIQHFKAFVYRAIHHLLLRDGVKTDQESLYLEEFLDFVPPCLEKDSDYGRH